MIAMHEMLDRLLVLKQAEGDVFYINPPLDAATIQATLDAHHLPCCDELIELYTWANGTEYSMSDTLFRDEVFISLEMAIEEHARVDWAKEEFAHRGLDFGRAVPFASFWGHVYVIYVGDIGELHHPIISIGDEVAMMYKDMPAMLATCLGWCLLDKSEDDFHNMSSPAWYEHNTVAGNPNYIDELHRRDTWISPD
jgi:hypothetical protein